MFNQLVRQVALAHGLDPAQFHQSVLADPTIGPHMAAAQAYMQRQAQPGLAPMAQGGATTPALTPMAQGAMAPPAPAVSAVNQNLDYAAPAPAAIAVPAAAPGAAPGGLQPAAQPLPPSQQTNAQLLAGSIAQGGMANRGALSSLMTGIPGATPGVPMRSNLVRVQ